MYIAPNTLNATGLVRGRFGMGGSFNQKQYTVAASQTIYAGDVLALTVGSAGVLTVQQSIAAPSAGSVTLSGGNLPILGVALNPVTANASGVDTSTGQTAVVNVALFDASLELLLRIYNATASASQQQDLTLGVPYQFGRYTPSSGNPFYVLSTTTTNGELVYVENYLESSVTDTYGPVWTRIAISETIQQG